MIPQHSVKYSSIDETADMFSKLEEGALLAKSDIKSTLRLLPISPGDFDLFGFQLAVYFYFDKMVTFGSSISCALWGKIGSFLTLAHSKTHRQKPHFTLSKLFWEPRQDMVCQNTLDKFKSLSQELLEKKCRNTTNLFFMRTSNNYL